VRINESLDDDELYERTNEVAHYFDPSRQTGGVRNIASSHLLEDVYTYNDFSQPGLAKPKSITKKRLTTYLVS
jgi:beta-galactosidase